MTKLQALSTAIIKAAKPGGPAQLTDGQGLFLELSWDAKGNPNHAWRFTYVSPVTGKRGNKLTFGRWPLTTIARARELANEARGQIAEGIDPKEVKQQAKAEQVKAEELRQMVKNGTAIPGSFRAVAELTIAHHLNVLRDWSPAHLDQFTRTLAKYVYPALGDRQCADIKPKDITDLIDPCDAARMFATSRNIRRFSYQVLARAVHMELCVWNAAANVKEVVMRQKVTRNRAAMTMAPDVRQLIIAIQNYDHDTKRRALLLTLWTWQRKANIRMMRWADVNLDAGVWTIPGETMKGSVERKEHAALNGEAHIVYLPTQAVAELRLQHAATGHLEWVFPSVFDETIPLPDDALNESLLLLGFYEDVTGADGKVRRRATHTPHGFRALGRTLAREELKIDKDVLEAQLAHVTDEELGTAYDRSKWLKERKAAMQQFADYLDRLVAEPVAQLQLAA